MTYFSNIKHNNDELSFELNNNDTIKLSIASAIRRLAISHVPTYSIDEKSVNFEVNTSMLHNGYLMKRLLLLPLNYNTISPLNIGEITFRLEKENTSTEILSVYTKDILVYRSNSIQQQDIIENIFIRDDILFGKLKPTQKIKVSGQFKKSNQSTDGTYFTPVCKSVITYKKDEKALAALDEKTRNIEGERYYLKNSKDEPAVYVFDIESIGAVSPIVIISSALGILKDKLETLFNAIKTDNKDKIQISISDKLFESYNFLIFDEDHTLGNMIEMYLLDEKEIYYAGYIVVHPNDNKLLITTALKPDISANTIENNKKVFINTIEKLIKLISILIDEWTKAQTKTETKKIKIKKV